MEYAEIARKWRSGLVGKHNSEFGEGPGWIALSLAADELEAALAASVAEQTQDDPEFAAAFAKGDAEIRAGLGVPLAASGTEPTCECWDKQFHECGPMNAEPEGALAAVNELLRLQIDRTVKAEMELAALRAVSQPTREQIARTIDPRAYAHRDSLAIGWRAEWAAALEQADAVLALYGKSEAKP